MKIAPNLNFAVIQPTKKSLANFVDMVRNVYQNFSQAFNGQIGFGDGTNQDNINGSWINVVAPGVANTDFTVNHNLGRLPVGYWIMQKDRACDIYTGSVAATATQLTLRASVASAVLRLFIIGLLLCIFSMQSMAQSTSVTLQVTDAGSQTWNNGTWSVVLVPTQNTPGSVVFNIIGGGVVPNQFQNGVLNVTGGASLTLTPNASIAPVTTVWNFTVCPQATAICFSRFITIAGATQTVTLNPPAILVSCGVGVNAYADSEVSCGVGGFYYNLITTQRRNCVTISGGSCTMWVGEGTGNFPSGGNVGSNLSYKSTDGTYHFTRQDGSFQCTVVFDNALTSGFPTTNDFSCDSLNSDGQRNLETYHWNGSAYIISSRLDLDQDQHFGLAAGTGGGIATDPNTNNTCIPATASPISCSTTSTQWNTIGQEVKSVGVPITGIGHGSIVFRGATSRATNLTFTFSPINGGSNTTSTACPGAAGNCPGSVGVYQIYELFTVSSAGTGSPTLLVTATYTDDVQAQPNAPCLMIGPSGVTTTAQAVATVGNTVTAICTLYAAANTNITVNWTFAGTTNSTVSAKTFLFSYGI